MTTKNDIDGTTRGRILVVSVHDFEGVNPELAYTYFDEPEYDDLERSALNFTASFAQHGDDYWDHHTLVFNERAKYLTWKRRMRELLGEDYGFDEYLKIKGD
jgi:hypothetical protein